MASRLDVAMREEKREVEPERKEKGFRQRRPRERGPKEEEKENMAA